MDVGAKGGSLLPDATKHARMKANVEDPVKTHKLMHHIQIPKVRAPRIFNKKANARFSTVNSHLRDEEVNLVGCSDLGQINALQVRETSWMFIAAHGRRATWDLMRPRGSAAWRSHRNNFNSKQFYPIPRLPLALRRRQIYIDSNRLRLMLVKGVINTKHAPAQVPERPQHPPRPTAQLNSHGPIPRRRQRRWSHHAHM